jgi:hypothetical protein
MYQDELATTGVGIGLFGMTMGISTVITLVVLIVLAGVAIVRFAPQRDAQRDV